MKAQGRRAGVADMFLAMPMQRFPSIFYYPYEMAHGLFIEFKSGKGKQSESQLAFQKAVTGQGYAYEVIYDFDQFKNLIETYLNP